MKRVFATLAAFTFVAATALVNAGARRPVDVPDGPSNQDNPHAAAVLNGARFVPGELIIQFREGATNGERAAARARVGAARKELLNPAAQRAAGRGVAELARVGGVGVLQAVDALKDDPAVAFAEPNWVYTHQAVSNDPYYTNGSLWGMYGDATSPANQYGSQAGEAWARGVTGSGTVYVGVIDEGVQYTHPDLDANMWTNPYDPVDGADNDGNGYADDTQGWDFATNDRTVYDGTADDHATHVAGTIGGEGGNGVGVAGVNWNVKMISCKFLGANGGTTANAVKAVDYITDLKVRHGLNIVATNNSWGGGGYSQALHDAVIRAAKQNILFIAAAGNGNILGFAVNNDSTANYPSNLDTSVGTSTESAAAYDAVIAVAALTNTGAKASYSNYGARTVDLAAPGSGVYSTIPSNSYGSMSGTSMATPHVTGGAALYASTHPGATAAAIRSAILASAVPTASMSGRCVTGGRLNVSGF